MNAFQHDEHMRMPQLTVIAAMRGHEEYEDNAKAAAQASIRQRQAANVEVKQP